MWSDCLTSALARLSAWLSVGFGGHVVETKGRIPSLEFSALLTCFPLSDRGTARYLGTLVYVLRYR